MSLFRRCRCFLRSYQVFHRGNAVACPVAPAVAACSILSQSHLVYQSSPQLSRTAIGCHWTTTERLNRWGDVTSGLGESAPRNGIRVSFIVTQQPPPPTGFESLRGEALGGGGWYGSSRDHKPRNDRKGFLYVNKFQTIEEAANGAFNKLHDLNPRALSSFWTRVSQLVASGYRMNLPAKQDATDSQRQRLMHQLKAIFSKTMGGLEAFGPRDLTQTVLGIAKTSRVIHQRRRNGTQDILHGILIGQQSQQKRVIFQSVAGASVAILSNFDARCLSNLAYANAIAGSVPKIDDGSTLFDHIAEKSIPLLRKFEPQNIANLVWSFEKVGESNPGLFEQVGDHIVSLDHLGKFNTQNISNISLAFAKAGEPHPGLFKKVAGHITSRDNLHSFEPQHLSNTVWAFTKAGEKQPRLFRKVADHIVSLDNLHWFKPQEISNTVWAFAKSGKSHPRLFKKVANHIVSLGNLHSFKPQEISNTVWAFATAGERHPLLFQRVANYIVSLDSLRSFKPQHLSNTVWAFATAGEKQPHLFQRVADHIISLDSLRSFNSQALSNTVWAFAKAGENQPRLFQKVADHIVLLDSLHPFKPQALSNTVWAFAEAGDEQPCLFQRVADHILALDNVYGFNSKDCSQLLWGFGAANVPHNELFARVAAHANKFDFQAMDEEDREMLLWAYEKAEASLEKKDDDDS